MLALACAVLLGAAQLPPGWTADLPDGAVPSEMPDGAAYVVPGQGVVVFVEGQKLSGRTLDEVADALVTTFEAKGAVTDAEVVPLDTSDPDAGRLVVAVVEAAGQPRQHTVILYPGGGGGDEVGVVMAVSEDEAPAPLLVLAAMTATFEGGAAEGGVASDARPAGEGADDALAEARTGEASDLVGTYVYDHTTTSIGVGGYLSMRIVPTVVTFTQGGWRGLGGPDEASLCEGADRPTSCRRYERRGDEVRIENGQGSWPEDGFEPLEVTGRGVTIGGTDYARIAPLDGFAVDARYAASTVMGAGGGPGSAGTAVGASSTELTLRRDGRYVRGTSSAVSASAPGGGFGSRGGGGDAGRYAVEGNWLTLTPDEGAPERLFVHARADGWREGDDAPATLHVGGRVFEKL